MDMFTRGLKMKVISTALGLMLMTPVLSGCTSKADSSTTDAATNKSAISVKFDSEDLNSSWDIADASQIILKGDTISLDGKGTTVKGDTVTIQSGGVYAITGTLNDGQIVVDTEDKTTVKLVLNGANITNLSSAPIYVKNAEKTVITLAEGTKNTITDGDTYTLEDASSDEPNAAVYSKDDLTINGTGSLTVNANYQNGITGKDDLKIAAGNITVNAVADGIKGKNYIAIHDGNIVVNAQSDGLQSNNDEDAAKGFVYIENGTLQISAGNDGIQAETSVLIKDGDITISSGGGSANGISQSNEPMPGMKQPGMEQDQDTSSTSTDTETESYKGIKASEDITIESGNIVLDTADDAIHSNDSIVINAGTISINSGDDGIHSDSTMVINGGEIKIDKSYEALESASITINDGSFHLTASDDGINTAGGNDGSSVDGRTGQNNFNATDGSKLNIKGGYIYVDAQGDGIDVNGDFVMTDGEVIVNGPTNNGNGALDYNGSFEMNGGFLVAAGSSGMAQAPGDTSSQASLMLNLGTQTAGTLISIQNEDGENILTLAPAKDYASVVISSPKLQEGSTYTVYTGGTSTGTEKDGLYSNGDYTPGTQVTSIKVSGTVSSYGQSSGGMQGGPTTGRPAGGPGSKNQ